MRISVIIPALNEEACIEQTLASVAAQTPPLEIIVVDGGSADATSRLAATTARVLSSAPGRSLQMNAGAAAATGDVFLFLHADTRLPPDALSAIRSALLDTRVGAGAFRLRFDRPTPLLRFYAYCTRFPIGRICFGDRALFVRRTAFDGLGGFPEIPLFEDLEMVRLLRQRGGFRFLPQAVTTSARRFERHGPLRQQLLNLYLWLRYVTGTDPSKLARYYAYDASGKQPV